MAVNHSGRHLSKYLINGLVLLLPIYYLFQSMTPSQIAAWPTKQIGDVTITPTPADLNAPYSHHAQYVKDFSFQLASKHIAQIRQGYANIGATALPLATLESGDAGVLHGNAYGLHAHAIAPPALSSSDKLWLTIQTWQGDVQVFSWELPAELLNTSP